MRGTLIEDLISYENYGGYIYFSKSPDFAIAVATAIAIAIAIAITIALVEIPEMRYLHHSHSLFW